jgi:hypothetical protein
MIDELEYMIELLRDEDMHTNVSGSIQIKAGQIVMAISDHLCAQSPIDHVYWR